MNETHLSDERLYLYLDDRLPVESRHEAEMHLARCATCRARLTRSTTLKTVLHDQLGRASSPAALRTSITQQIRRRQAPDPVGRRLFTFYLGLAVVAAILLLATGLVVIRRWADPARPLLSQLVAAYTQAEEPADVRGDAKGVADGLRQRLGWRVSVPEVAALDLMGGRVTQVDGQPAAHVVYRLVDGTPFSLLIWRGGPTAISHLERREYEGGTAYVASQDGENIVLWEAHGMVYACVSSTDLETLIDVSGDLWQAIVE